MTTTKRSFDFEQLRGTLAHPAVTGGLLGAMPEMTRAVAAPTGGLGLYGLVDLLRNRGANFGSFFRGRIADRSPVPPPTATPGSSPTPQAKMMPARTPSLLQPRVPGGL